MTIFLDLDMATRSYLDTFYLRGIVSKDRGERALSNRLLSRISQKSFEVIIPQVVMGEFFAIILRDSKREEINEQLMKMINKLHDINLDINSCIPPPNEEVFNCIQELRNQKVSLDPTDLVIVAHALADPDSKFLFTTDKKMIESDIITVIEKKMRQFDNKRNIELEIKDSL